MKISIGRDRPSGIYANGEIITYTIKASNLGATACLVNGVTMVLHLPAADGTPTGQTVPLGSNLAFNVGSDVAIAQVPYKLAVNANVVDAVAEVQVTAGLLHDVANDHQYRELKQIGTDVVKPRLLLDKTGDTVVDQAPKQVNYFYDVTNDSAAPIPLNQVTVEDDICIGPTYLSGDNGDRILSPKETWRFTCTMLHQAPGVYVNTAKACATNTLDGTKVCSEPDTWKVTLNPPPVPPPPANPPAVQGAVKGQQVAQAPEKCTLATPSGLKVRAREQTTIRVTVRNVDAGSVARITLPDGKVLREKTNKNGVATFKVKPSKTGTATIRVADCADVERLTVRPARQVVAQRVPRVTG